MKDKLRIFSGMLYIIMGIYMIYESDGLGAICVGFITILSGILVYQYYDKLVIYIEGDTNE